MASNQTEASGIFKSQGSMLQQEGTVLSTKTIRFSTEPLEEWRTVNSRSESESVTDWYDPLAQTFLVEEPGGCFITKIDIFFQSKDTTLPVSIQIREVVNGYPGSRVLPYSEVTLRHDQVNISETSLDATTFVMDAPVYLQENTEYCFVVYSDSFEYNVWIAELGQIDLDTGDAVAKQPYSGVLFKSQNASTWTADQNQDMKFILYKAVFDIDTAGVTDPGTLILENDDLPYRALSPNPIETFDGSTKIRIHHPNHGFNISEPSVVTINNLDDPDPGVYKYNNILASSINDTHNVLSVELDSFIINPDGGIANKSGRVGGGDEDDPVYATYDVNMDVLRPNITELVLPSTNTQWAVKTTSGQSVNGSQIPYSIGSSYYGINPVEINQMAVPKVITSVDNEPGGNKTLIFEGTLISDNRNISPVIDLNRVAAIAVSNRIDSPLLSDATTVELDSTINSTIVTVTLVDHGLMDTAIITLTPSGDLGGILEAELTGDFTITRTSDDTFDIETNTEETVSTANRTAVDTIIYSTTNYKYVPETDKKAGTVLAKYMTSKITLKDSAIGFKLLFTSSIQVNSIAEIYYKKQGPYDTRLFQDIEYVLLEDTALDTFVPISESAEDFREYEYSVDFRDDPAVDDGEDFVNIAFKIVMTSIDSTRVPIFKDLRVICLGT